MYEWINKKVNTTIPTLETDEEYQDIISKDIAVLLITEETNSEQIDAYRRLAMAYEKL